MRCYSTTCMVALFQVQFADKRLGFPLGPPLSIQSCAKGVDNRHKVTYQILMPILREVDHLNGASLSGEQRVEIGKAKTSCPIFVLNNNHPDRRVRQQAEKARAAVIDSGTYLFDDLGDLIPFRATVRYKPVRLSLKIGAIFSCRNTGIDGN
jgi:hypothetical protein